MNPSLSRIKHNRNHKAMIIIRTFTVYRKYCHHHLFTHTYCHNILNHTHINLIFMHTLVQIKLYYIKTANIFIEMRLSS